MRLAVLDDWQGVAEGLADWASLGAATTFFGDSVAGEALVERLRPFEVVCLMRERTAMPEAVIDRLPNLRLIVTTGPRNVAIDAAACAARGVTVCGTAGRAAATAHLTLALMLAGMRRLGPELASMRAGGWQVGLGRDLDGLTLGLVGLGRIGAQVAALARPFGMDTVAWSANLTDARCAEAGVRRAADLGSLLAEADVVSLHLVLSERTRGLIGAEALAAMKPDALLVNTSRAGLIDTGALPAALRAGRPWAAALDVFDHEPPPPDDPLRDAALIDAGRLILTPHLGYVSRQTYEVFYRETVAAVAAWAAGAPVGVIASPAAGAP